MQKRIPISFHRIQHYLLSQINILSFIPYHSYPSNANTNSSSASALYARKYIEEDIIILSCANRK